jgi:signal transduction histidine kinase
VSSHDEFPLIYPPERRSTTTVCLYDDSGVFYGVRLTLKLLFAILCVLSIGDGGVFAQDQKQVLVLYGTRRDAQIAVVGDRELPGVLERGLASGLDYYSEFLDQARLEQPTYLTAFREFLRVKYSAIHFDLVIAMGEAPLRFAAEHRQAVFGDTPIVFFSDRAVPRPPNTAGLLAPANFGDTIALANALQPASRDVYVISGATPNNQAILELAREQLRAFEPQLSFHYWSALPTRELEARLAGLPADAIVYYLLVDRDGSGENVHPLEYIDRIIAASNAPVYCWVDSAMNRGIIGGSLKDQQAQSLAVGELALRVLRGERADSIPLASPNLDTRQVDWRQLRRWRIAESRVPSGTVIRFRQPSAWEEYRNYFIAGGTVLIAQAMLIGGLLIQRQRRRLAESRLLKQQDELRHSYDRIRDLGSRLLEAQENERARIARELHDDICQQMAALAIRLESLRRTVQGPAETQMRETVVRAQTIARNIHNISHSLHPHHLHILGLVGALKDVEREWSNPGMTLTLVHDEVPPLSAELSLCLFRIVQEALQNALRYSEGHHVTVTVAAADHCVRLTVTDDGVGFNIDRRWGEGLGLISMRERVEAVGGTLQIASSPGAGTKLIAAVPVSPGGKAHISP